VLVTEQTIRSVNTYVATGAPLKADCHSAGIT
jgi:hypothetical protein